MPLASLAAPGITLLGSFAANGSNGVNPYAALTAAGNGLYYGTTIRDSNGNGAIYAFDSTTGSITLKSGFAADGSNGSYPYAALTSAGNGLYYGTSYYGGTDDNGAVFAFDSATGSITLKGSFASNGSSASNPYAALTSAGNGLYYGTTYYGGANDKGTVFAFDSATGSITLKGSFAANRSNGAYPSAALTSAGNGLYYGTTTEGGTSNKGAVFAFDSATGSITLKGSFAANGSNGANPNAALIAAGNGLYYGTTTNGGANNTGAVFAFDSATGSITLKGSFAADRSNGSNPYAALTAAGNGLYYGTTTYGGANGKGAIFSFDSVTGSISLQGSFAADSSNGANPHAALTAGANGVYYGTTLNGGANGKGAIFSFDLGDPISAPVPGPLPVVGIGAAFGWSRQLRRRVAQASQRKA